MSANPATLIGRGRARTLRLGRRSRPNGPSIRRLSLEALEDRNLLAGILSVSPNSATQGTANLSVTINLDSSAVPPAPPAFVVPQSATLGTISGSSLAHPSQYVVTGAFTIPSGESAGAKDVTVSFPGPQGTVSFSLTGGFTVVSAAAPEIQLLDGTTDIADGTGSDSFGSTVLGTPVSKTFTVKNLGTSALTLTAPITVPAGFTVTSSFGSTTVAAGASTTFIVRLDATAAGSYSGTLSFANNDGNENPFNFTLAATVTATAEPEIQVLDGTTDIPDDTGSVSWGSTFVGTPISKTFTVKNVGTANLTLTAPIAVPAGFTVTSPFGSTTLAAGASTTFTVRMDATSAGAYSGAVSFADNDGNENPFNFALSGTVVAAPSHTYTVVDTGQTKSYNATTEITAPAAGQAFYGQDGQIQGVQPSYTLNADGLTVYDNRTGLTWQHTPETTGDSSLTAADKLSWTNAQARPAALNAAHYGGFSDWRLPTIKELYSLIDFRGTDPSGLSGSDTSSLTPFIDRNYFQFAYGDTTAGERIIDSQYASSNLYVGNTTLLFGVNFADGRIKGYGLTLNGSDKTFFVQCVRGNTSYGINSFTAGGDGTVTDSATGLMWTQADSGSGMNWQDALAWAQTKNAQNYLGHNDWRLPNAKELQSIVDYTRSPATTSSAAINAVFSCTQITNEANQADYPWYWTGTTHAAYNGSAASASYVCFGRALGYMNSSWVDIHGAGCQRSDPKSGSLSSYTYVAYGYYNSIAPQGDAIRLYNYVRLVRDAATPAPEIQVLDGTTELADGAASVAFGSTAVGGAVNKTITVKNVGTSDLTLTAPIAVPAGFTVTSSFGATTLAAGGSTTFTVRLDAAAAGSFAGTLSFANNDGNENPFDIAVSGTVTATAITGRYVLYNNSAFDGNSAGADDRDYDAIAPAPSILGHGHAGDLDEPAKQLGKQALLPGQTASLANYTSYAKGINAIAIAFDNLPAAELSTADFVFRTGNDDTPADWDAAPQPLSIRVDQDADHASFSGDPDVVTITWADDDPYTPARESGAISNQWLQVTVLTGANTGLAANDVFYFGNQIGESGNASADANVDQNDEIGARNHPHTAFNAAALSDPYDINRDGKVDQNDEILARNNPASAFTRIALIAAPAMLQAALPGISGGVASALDAALEDDLGAIVAEAISRWAAAGLTVGQVQTLRQTRYVVTDFAGSTLAEACARSGAIYVDADAAGAGWFLDPTPTQDEEFSPGTGRALPGRDACDKVDLLTAVMHEMGHMLGRPDLDEAADALMASSLANGLRRAPADARAVIVRAVLLREAKDLFGQGDPSLRSG